MRLCHHALFLLTALLLRIMLSSKKKGDIWFCFLKRLKFCRVGDKAQLLCLRPITEGTTRRIKMVYCERRSKIWLVSCDGIRPHTTNCNPNLSLNGSVSGPFLPIIINSEEEWGWKGLHFSSPTSSSEQGQLKGQTRLLRTLPSKVLKTSKDTDCITSLGSMPHCLTALTVEKSLHIPGLKLSCFFLCLLFSFSYHAPLWRALLHLLDNIPVDTSRLLLVSPKAVSSPGWTIRFLQGKCSSSELAGCLLNSLQFIEVYLVLESQNCMRYLDVV